MKQFTWAQLATIAIKLDKRDEYTLFDDQSTDETIDDVQGYFGESELNGAFHMIPITITNEGITIPDDFDVKHWEAVLDVYTAMIEMSTPYDDITDEQIHADTVHHHTDDIILAGRNYERSTRDERGADDGTYDYVGSYVDMELEWIDELLHGE